MAPVEFLSSIPAVLIFIMPSDHSAWVYALSSIFIYTY